MEGIRGTSSFMIDAATLARRLAHYQEVVIDIGTGDGRYVKHVARTSPACFAIGIDACRENLRRTSRTAPDNALYLIANALALPHELHRLAARITINFPWGSLLEGLLDGDAALLGGIGAIARPGATLEVRLNGGALDEAGRSLEAGGEQVRRRLRDSGFVVAPPQPLNGYALRACPTTWAQRLAFGRDPRALYLRARCPVQLPIADCRLPIAHSD
jgi:16S rRNA (adenine(1408)-N(1))-methyltransferase